MIKTKRRLKSSETTLDLVKRKPVVWLFPLLTVMVMVMGTSMVVRPQIAEIISTRKKLAVAEETLDKLVDKRKFLEEMANSSLDQDLEETKRVLPDRKPVYTVVEDLSQELAAHEITLVSYDLSPGGVASEGAVTEEIPRDEGVDPDLAESESQPQVEMEMARLEVSLDMVGTVGRMVEWMERLRTLAPLTSVEAMSFEVDPGEFFGLILASDNQFGQVGAISLGAAEEPAEQIEMQTKMSIYYMPAVTIDQAIGEPLPELEPELKKVLAKLAEYQEYQPLTGEGQQLLPESLGRENVFAY